MSNNFEIEITFNMEEFLKECKNVVLDNEDFEEDDIRFKTPNEAFQYINNNCEKRGIK